MLLAAAEQHLASPPVAHWLREQRAAYSGAPQVVLPVRAADTLDSDDSELQRGAAVPERAPGRDKRLEAGDSPRPGSADPGSLAQTERD